MSKKRKLLLHVCCVGCGVYVARELSKDFDVVMYFYNPNIFPEKEHMIRLNEARKISHELNIRLIEESYNHTKWLDKARGLENEPEKGKRCTVCYGDRLNKTAEMAKELGFEYFTTTLTTSPHKDAKRISEIGNKISVKLDIGYLDKDFKKEDGFNKTCKLSKELGLYRQEYCGCEFSVRK